MCGSARVVFPHRALRSPSTSAHSQINRRALPNPKRRNRRRVGPPRHRERDLLPRRQATLGSNATLRSRSKTFAATAKLFQRDHDGATRSAPSARDRLNERVVAASAGSRSWRVQRRYESYGASALPKRRDSHCELLETVLPLQLGQAAEKPETKAATRTPMRKPELTPR